MMRSCLVLIFMLTVVPLAMGQWSPPPGGWDYVYDPDAGSPEDLDQDGWVHDNGSDQYVFQPQTADGQTFANAAFISDDEGGQCLRLYDPGDTRNAPYSLSDPGGRKISISKDLGAVEQVTVAFRIRSIGFTDDYGVDIPAGYASEYCVPIIGVRISRSETQNESAWSGAGMYMDAEDMTTLSFPSPGVGQDGRYLPTNKDFNWNHAEWHSYWITYDISNGGAFTLYADGKMTPKFPTMGLEAGAQTQDAEGGIPDGNLAILIWLGATGNAGTLEIDRIAAKVGKFTPAQAALAAVPTSDDFDAGIGSQWSFVNMGDAGTAASGQTGIPSEGKAEAVDGQLHLTNNGWDAWEDNDGMAFLYQVVTGDFDVIVHMVAGDGDLDSPDIGNNPDPVTGAGDQFQKGGLVFRASLDTGAPYVGVMISQSRGLRSQYRLTQGAATDRSRRGDDGSGPKFGWWARLVRTGDVFQQLCAESKDGPWLEADDNVERNLPNGTLAIEDPGYLGIMYCPHSAGNVSVYEGTGILDDFIVLSATSFAEYYELYK